MLKKLFLKCSIYINQLYHLLKIAWRNTYFSGCPTYLTVVLNLDVSGIRCKFPDKILDTSSVCVIDLLPQFPWSKMTQKECYQYILFFFSSF